MLESDFLERWQKEGACYAAWGRFVANELRDAIAQRVAPTTLELFLKMPVVPRLKETESLLQKAFRRNKGYQDAWAQIEDKIGFRLVVLVEDDVRTIESVICDKQRNWTANKARDFLEERDANPSVFGYQSLHYILKPSSEFEFEDYRITNEMNCEVQVRTLLQHAFSELTHDTIYKPSVQATPSVQRLVARSMALIEVADDTFSAVSKAIKSAAAPGARLAALLAVRYEKLVEEAPSSTPLNSLIIDHYKMLAGNDFEYHLDRWLDEKPYVSMFIRERRRNNSLFRVPSVLMLYYMIAKYPRQARIDCPVVDEDLEMMYSDLGLAFYGL